MTHEWLEVTSMEDTRPAYLCRGCGVRTHTRGLYEKAAPRCPGKAPLLAEVDRELARDPLAEEIDALA